MYEEDRSFYDKEVPQSLAILSGVWYMKDASRDDNDGDDDDDDDGQNHKVGISSK